MSQTSVNSYLVPFGAYLRELRTRRGHSLAEIESLSSRAPDPINKGYLSRVENGQQSISLSKIIALARIYDCPPGALIDRLEMDMAAAEVEVPEFENAEEAIAYAQKQSDKGYVSESYAVIRELQSQATTEYDKHRKSLSLTTPAIFLGKYDFAKYELLRLRELDGIFSLSDQAFVLERLGKVYQHRSQFLPAQQLLRKAHQLAEESGDISRQYYTSNALASHALTANMPEESLVFYQQSFELAKEFDTGVLKGKTLSSIAACYIDLGKLTAARHAIEAADKIAQENKSISSISFLEILRGRIAYSEKRLDHAKRHWQQAIGILKPIRYHRFRFEAELDLLDLAIVQQEQSAIRSIDKRLQRLLPWFPKDEQMMQRYRDLQYLLSSGNKTVKSEKQD